MFQPDRRKAEPGDIIEFKKNKHLLEGEVMPSNATNSVVVDISASDGYEKVNLGYHNTVVAHDNYRVIDKSEKDDISKGSVLT